MKRKKTNKDSKLEKYTKLVEDYFLLEKEYYDYLSQFFPVYINGKIQNTALKGDNQVEFEKRKEMKKQLEENKKKVMETQRSYLFYLNKN